MTMSADQVVAEALQKTAEERAMIAAKLISSLDTESDQDVEVAWQAEVTRRVQELDEGTAKRFTWDEVKARVPRAIHAIRHLS